MVSAPTGCVMRVLVTFCVLVLVAACASAGEESTRTQAGPPFSIATTLTTESLVDTTTSSVATTTTTALLNVIQIGLLDSGAAFGPADSLDVVYHDGSRWLAAGWKATAEAIEEEGAHPRACWYFPDLCEGAIWQSVDGVTWAEPVLLGRGVDVVAFAGSEAGTIALGTAPGDDGLPRPAVWTPSGGDGWSRVEATAPNGTGMIRDGTSNGDQFVAVGVSCRGQDCLSDVEFTGSPAVWVSEDGQTWEQAEVFGISGVINRVLHTGEYWVAAGDTGNPLTATAWTSTDGRSWTDTAMPAVPNPEYDYLLEEGASEDFEECNTGVRALGADFDGRVVASGICVTWFTYMEHSTAWYSDDGLDWAQIADTETAFGEPGGVRDVIYTGTEFLLIGYVGDPGIPTVWTSLNGKIWASQSLDIDGYLPAIAI